MMSNEKLYTIVYFMDYGKKFGGAYTTLLHQIVLMKKLGHRVIVFFSDYYGKEMSVEYQKICEQFDIGYEWETYQFSSQPEDFDIICIIKNYDVLREKISRYNPDILHSVQINPCVELISRELKIPHIMNVYQLISDFFSLNYMNIFPHYHICDSIYYAEKWRHYLKTDSVCIRTIADKVTTVRKKLDNDNIKFICVGTISERKNQIAVIKAFHKALKYGIKGKLTLCGYANGQYFNKCQQYIEDNGLQKIVIFKGFCTDMNNEYEYNDVLICASTCESYPNVISEAMTNGLVIVSTPVAGVPEIIEDGKNGYLTKDFSAEAIFEKMMQASDDIVNGQVEKILDNAQNTFRENHLPQVVARQLVKYYQHVLEDYNKWIEERDTLKIGEVRSAFQGIIKRFKKFEHEFTYPQKVSIKLWYLYHILYIVNNASKKEKKFFIWGTGIYGTIVKEIVEVFFPQIFISGFIDSKKSGKFCDYKIYNADEIIQKECTIIFIAAVNGQSEMIKKLEAVGKNFNKDYFILSARAW